jgi:hypothetical protein
MPTCANPRCGAEFTARRKDQRACSSACTSAASAARQKAKYAADPTFREAKLAYEKARQTDPAIGPRIRAYKRAARQTAVYGQPTPDILMQTKDKYRHARALGFRSGLEVKNARHLEEKGAAFEYEPYRLPYVKPERNATYTPDFVLASGIIIDTKGVWLVEDRQKFALLKAQHPDLDIRMVFTNPQQKISKGSKTSYADICNKLGIPFAKDTIPSAWLTEPANGASLAAIERLRK